MTNFARSAPAYAPLSLVIALALGLGACSKQPAPSADASSQAAPEPSGQVETVPVESPSPAVTEEEPAPTIIPATLRGRWGLLNADCTSTAGDAKGLLTIGAKQLKFYESVADLKSVSKAGADAVTGNFDFTGEGQSWSLQVALTSLDGGKTLVRKDTGPDALPQALTYRKCA